MRSLILQGGGCRTFFQLGLLEVAGGVLGPFEEMGTVSASSAMGCIHALGIHGEAFRRFALRVRGNRANFYPLRLLGGRRATPHFDMYRDTILECVSPSRFLELQRQPMRIRILIGVGPVRSAAVAVALATYTAVTRRRSPFITPHIVDVRDLSGPEALADAILTSSAFPPFTPLARLAGYGGRPGIDGGAVELIPLSLASAGAEVTAILTRPAPPRPLPWSVRQIAPVEPLPVALWDYANERRLTETYDIGRRAGELLIPSLTCAQRV